MGGSGAGVKRAGLPGLRMIPYIAIYQIMEVNLVLSALANPHRRQILDWLRAPRRHFPPPLPEHRDLPGVCASHIFEKSELSQPTVSQYLQILERAGLLRRRRHGRWTFYSRDEAGIAQARALIDDLLGGAENG